MKIPTYWLMICLVAVAFFSDTRLLFGQAEVFIESVKLPPGWRLQRTYIATEEQLNALRARLDCKLVRGVNYIVDADGIGLQVKVGECGTEQDAKKLFQLFLSTRNNAENRIILKGNIIFEFVSNSAEIIRVTKSLFENNKAGQDDLRHE
jgi:hypothetical protein